MEHEGHRTRIRKRFITQGLEGFEHHEALELLLTFAIPRMDVNPIAHRLLSHFGSFHKVLQAHPRELMQVEGIGESAATLISMLLPLLRRYQIDAAQPNIRLETYADLSAYCTNLFLGATDEQLYLLCFDGKLKLLATELIARGTPDEVTLLPRQIVQALLRHQALGAVITHNHPSGFALPSQEDADITRNIHQVLKSMGIRLYDHILIAGHECFSFNQHGYLDEETIIPIRPISHKAADRPLNQLPPRKK